MYVESYQKWTLFVHYSDEINLAMDFYLCYLLYIDF